MTTWWIKYWHYVLSLSKTRGWVFPIRVLFSSLLWVCSKVLKIYFLSKIIQVTYTASFLYHSSTLYFMNIAQNTYSHVGLSPTNPVLQRWFPGEFAKSPVEIRVICKTKLGSNGFHRIVGGEQQQLCHLHLSPYYICIRRCSHLLLESSYEMILRHAYLIGYCCYIEMLVEAMPY